MLAERIVTLSDGSTKAIVSAVTANVVDAVTRTRQLEMLEQYQSFARQEVELTKAREEVARLQQEIAGLRQHIGTLNNFIANMTPANGVPSYASQPYPNGAGQYPSLPAPPLFTPFIPPTPATPEPRPGD